MNKQISRRGFLAGAASVAGAFAMVPEKAFGQAGLDSKGKELDFPLVDYHVHLDQVVTLEKALQLSKERGVKFGIVEHAGTKENRYPNLISDDEGMKRYVAMLAGKPVYRGIQAEGLDWPTCFSKEVVAQLDYVLSDALTFPEKDGRRVELWRPSVKIEDKQDFMDRYTDFNVQVIAREPIDILANPTLLPNVLKDEHDALWTPARMEKIIEAAVKHRVAIEINSNYRLPRPAFLKLAKKAGVKFSFGSNIHGLDVGKLDYCVEMAKELGLKRADIFTPAPPGEKPIQRRAV
jgi:histidinol phosphatase-like PHP family hydrolase